MLSWFRSNDRIYVKRLYKTLAGRACHDDSPATRHTERQHKWHQEKSMPFWRGLDRAAVRLMLAAWRISRKGLLVGSGRGANGRLFSNYALHLAPTWPLRLPHACFHALGVCGPALSVGDAPTGYSLFAKFEVSAASCCILRGNWRRYR
jgi:hypothetical protein